MKKKILVIGNSAKEYALAKFLSKENDVYVAPGSATIKEFATCIDIREDAISELLEFAVETGIDLTIPTSLKSLKTNIVDIFNNNQQQIFAPTQNALNTLLDKTSLKKLLYKLRVPTPRFGIFEKQNMAMDYIKNLKNPFVIKTNEPSSAIVLTSKNTAKSVLDSYFVNKNQKVVIEDYIWGTPFSFYALTDGYKALPLGSSILYKHLLDGDGGQLTSGMGACIPNYKLSVENEYFIMEDVIYPLLEYLQAGQNPYVGIFGIDGILTEDGNVQILGFQPFLQDCDCIALLRLLNIDFVDLISSCVVGSFSDEVDDIPQKELTATSLVLYCKNTENKENIIEGLDSLDENTDLSFYPQVTKNRYLEYEAEKGNTLILTTFGRTPSSSAILAYDEVKSINFKGLYYRKDICKPSNEML